MNVAARVAFALTVPVLVAGALFVPQHRAAYASSASFDARARLVEPDEDARRPAEDSSAISDEEGDEVRDLYGNAVTDAVAKYKFDAAGSLYEAHSPQTELPRLGSPKS